MALQDQLANLNPQVDYANKWEVNLGSEAISRVRIRKTGQFVGSSEVCITARSPAANHDMVHLHDVMATCPYTTGMFK